MKASLKFRDDQTPLFRAKLPLNFLDFPCRAGVVAGSSKELSLQLSTFFDSGPSLKLAYNPLDASKPFNLALKAGIGSYGSPINSSVVVSTGLNLDGRGNLNPSFSVHFKPRFGDFGISKKQSPSVHLLESFEIVGHTLPFASRAAQSILKDVEMNVTTSLPVSNMANVKFHWGVRFPTEVKNMLSKNDGFVTIRPPAVSFRNIQFLAMNKISIERVRGVNAKEVGQEDSVIPRLDALRDENETLRKAVEDLRSEVSSVKNESFFVKMMSILIG